jgi:hypothetical protein
MVCFQTKNPNVGKFRRALEGKKLVYFMSIWNVFGHLVIWGHLGIFGDVCSEADTTRPCHQGEADTFCLQELCDAEKMHV